MPPKAKTTAVNIRLDVEIVQQLDELAQRESDTTGYDVTRSDVIKRALREWLEARPKKR